MALRLFAGIALDEQIRATCADVAARLRNAGLSARFEAPEKYHLTLAFLGPVEPERIGDIQVALASAAASCTRFALVLDRVGAFPHEHRPRVVFLGARRTPPPFQALAGAVRGSLEPQGFDFGQQAIPHVTLARVRGGNAHLPLLALTPIALEVRAVTLFESMRDSATSRYEVRFRTPLNDGA